MTGEESDRGPAADETVEIAAQHRARTASMMALLSTSTTSGALADPLGIHAS